MPKSIATPIRLLLLLLLFGTAEALAQTASFTINGADSRCNPAAVSFTNTSTGFDPATMKFVWFSGIGTASADRPNLDPVSFIYNTAAVYTVRLAIVRTVAPNDTLSNATRTLTINPFPRPEFTVTGAAECNIENVTLTASPPGMTRYTWSLGDGQTRTGQSLTYRYAQSGTYTISLQVEDANGCRGDVSRQVNVRIGLPTTLSINANQPLQACAPPITGVLFTPNLTTTSPGPFVYQWDFDYDGTTFDVDFTGPNPPARGFLTPTTRTIALRLNDQFTLCPTIATTTVNIVPLDVRFNASVRSGCAPLTVTFTNTSVGLNPATQRAIWDFGDGTVEERDGTRGENITTITRTFTDPDQIRQVRLRVTDGLTCDGTSLPLEIQTFPAVQANFTSSDRFSCANSLAVTFDATSSVASAANGPVQYDWTFTAPGGATATATGPTPSFTFNGQGAHGVRLRVTSGDGCTNEVNFPAYISLEPLVAEFSAAPNNQCVPNNAPLVIGGCAPYNAPLFDQSTPNIPGKTWLWEVFVAGTATKVAESTLQDPNDINIAQAGVYDVQLTVTAPGCTPDVERKNNYIRVGLRPTRLGITPDRPEICNGQIVNYFLDYEAHPDINGNPFPIQFFWEYLPANTYTDGPRNPTDKVNPTGVDGANLYDDSDPNPIGAQVWYYHNGCWECESDFELSVIRLPRAVVDFFPGNCATDPALANQVFLNDQSRGADERVWRITRTPAGGGPPTVAFFADPNLTFTLAAGERIDWDFVAISACGYPTPADTFAKMCNALLTDPTLHNFVPGEYFGDPATASLAQVLATVGFPGCVHEANGTFTMPPTINDLDWGTLNVLNAPGNCAPATYQFETPIAALTPGLVITDYYWDFGNGEVRRTGTSPLSGNVVYDKPGVYTVRVVITTDNGGCTFFHDYPPITVSGAVPNFDYCQAGMCANNAIDDTNFNIETADAVRFVDRSVSVNPIQTWDWDFGDGSSLRITRTSPTDGQWVWNFKGTPQAPITLPLNTPFFYNYRDAQTPQDDHFVVSLTVDDGVCPPRTTTAKVRPTQPVPAVKAPVVSPRCGGSEVTFRLDDRPPLDAVQPLRLIWTVKDASDVLVLSLEGDEETREWILKDNLGAEVERIAFDPSVGLGIDSISVFVPGNHGDLMNFELQLFDQNDCPAMEVGIFNLETYELLPDFEFTSETDGGGTPINFIQTQISGECPDLIVYFRDLTNIIRTPPPGHEITYTWRFIRSPAPDDFVELVKSEAEKNVSHVFTAPITNDPDDPYDVELIVTDNFGCEQSVIRLDIVNLGGPLGTFTMTPERGYVGVPPAQTPVVPPTELTVAFEGFPSPPTALYDYKWDFGVGNLGFGQTTSYTYTEDDLGGRDVRIYNPRMILTDDNGCTYSPPIPQEVTLYLCPRPDLPVNQVFCVGQGDRTFRAFPDDYEVPLGNLRVRWLLNGVAQPAANDRFTFRVPAVVGVHTLRVETFVNVDGTDVCQGYFDQMTVEFKPMPTADFAFDGTNFCFGEQVTFTDASNANGGAPLQYIRWEVWNNGDPTDPDNRLFASANLAPGTPMRINGAGALYNFPSPATYRIRIVARAQPVGGQAEGCETISPFEAVNIRPIPEPTLNFRSDPDPTDTDDPFCDGTPIRFGHITLYSRDQLLNETGATYAWDFNNDGDFTDATDQSPVHTFPGPGTYTVRMEVTSAFGCKAIATTMVRISPIPVPSFTVTEACIGSPVSFVNTSTIQTALLPGATIERYLWDLDNDGTTDLETSLPTVTPDAALQATIYTAPGVYTARLTTISTHGCSESFTEDVFIHPIPVADFTIGNGCTDSELEFDAAASSVTNETGTPITLYEWDFNYNGTTFNPTFSGDNTDPATSATSGRIARHTYGSPGTYRVALRVSTDQCSSVIVDQETVVHPLPVASFSFTPECLGTEIAFDASASAPAPGGTILRYEWDFDYDGTTFTTDATRLASATDPDQISHLFPTPGVKRVALRVVNEMPDGIICESVPFAQNVSVFPIPTADFVVQNNAGDVVDNTSVFLCEGDVVRLDASTSLTNAVPGITTNIIRYEWDFTDDGTDDFITGASPASPIITRSAGQPGYVFATEGLKPVRLRVVTNNGCSHIVTVNVRIWPRPVFSFPDLEGCLEADVRPNGAPAAGFGYRWEQLGITGGTIEPIPAADLEQHTFRIKAATFTAARIEVRFALTVTNTTTGCDTRRETTVTLYPDPVLVLTTNPAAAVCAGNTITLAPNALLPNVGYTLADYSFLWTRVSQTGGTVTETTPNTERTLTLESDTFAGNAPIRARYRLRVINLVTNCEEQEEIDVEFRPNPVVSLVQPEPLCPDETFTIRPEQPQLADHRYIWERVSLTGGTVTETGTNDHELGVAVNTFSGTANIVATYRLRLRDERYLGEPVPTACETVSNTITLTFVRKPVASFTAAPACANAEVNLNAAATSAANGTLLRYEWDFDYDGTTFTADRTVTATAPADAQQTVIYPTAGIKTIGLRVFNETLGVECQSDIVQRTVEVYPNPTPSFIVTNAEEREVNNTSIFLCEGDVVRFDARASTANAVPGITTNIIRYDWDFDNNGTFEVSTTDPVITRAPGQPGYVFGTAGDKTVNLRVVTNNGTGCPQVTSQVVTIQPVPRFTFPVLRACSQVQMRTNEPAAAGFSYRWEQVPNSLAGGTLEDIPAADLNRAAFTIRARSFVSRQITVRFRLTVTNNQTRCTTTDEVEATLLPTPIVVLLASPSAAACEGETISIAPNNQLPGPGYSESEYAYTWEKLSETGGTTQETNPLNQRQLTVTSGTFAAYAPVRARYRLTVRNIPTGCEEQEEIEVIFRPTPVVTVPTPDAICADGSLTLTPTEPRLANHIYEWERISLSGGGLIEPNLFSYSLTLRAADVNNPTPITATYRLRIRDERFNAQTFPTRCEGLSNEVTITIHPKPLARFTPTIVCAGTATTFNAAPSDSKGAPITLYEWDFTYNGTTFVRRASKTDADPDPANISFTYIGPGTYTAALRITNANGCVSDVFTQQVTVHPNPTPRFSFVSGNICSGEPVAFTDESSVANPLRFPNDRVTGWSWNFGDGSPASTQQNPVHTFERAGTYTVTLTIRTNNSCPATVSRQITIHPRPVPKFTAEAVCLTETTVFTDESTIAPDFTGAEIPGNRIVEWNWDFGDGNTLRRTTGGPIRHRYETAGIYTATLTLRTDKGCVSEPFEQTITINPRPVAAFIADTVCVGTPTTFRDLTTLPDNAVNTRVDRWEWDFGDDNGTASTQNPSYAFSAPGTYEVRLITRTATNCADTIVQKVLVRPLPTADFEAPAVTEGSPTPFTDRSAVVRLPADVVQRWDWDFGAGVRSSERNPSYTFPRAGTYDVTLTVFTDTLGSNTGCAHTITRQVVVHPKPKADFVFTEECHQDVPTRFRDQTTLVLPPGANDRIVRWSWDFGDGRGRSDKQNPDPYTYARPGTYTVRLIVETNNAAKDTATQQVRVFPKPLPAFTATSVCFGERTRFSNQTQIDTDFNGQPIHDLTGVRWFWAFGNGETSTEAEPEHQYGAPGVYLVNLRVITANGCENLVSREVVVYPNPIPAFTADAVCRGGVTTFTNQSALETDEAGAPVPGASIARIEWSFGDGSQQITSNVATIRHTYRTAGRFRASIRVISSQGCIRSIEREVFVHPNPIVGVAASVKDACLGDPIAFRNTTALERDSANQNIPGNSIVKWAWYVNGTLADSSQNFPTQRFSRPGTYIVRLDVTTNNGCTGSGADTVRVRPLPRALFSANAVCEGGTTVFTDASAIVGLPAGFNDRIVEWRWNFGDGNAATATTNRMTHQYAAARPGGYRVNLSVRTNYGCVHDTTFTVIVHPLPLAQFSTRNVCLNEPATFTDRSTLARSGFAATDSIVSWQWEFGDGGRSNLRNPTHQYTRPGIYLTRLTVRTNNGCTHTSAQQEVTVFPLPRPTAGADRYICQGDSTTLTASGGVRYQWSNGMSGASIRVAPRTTTRYTVTVFDQNGCSAQASVAVNVIETPVLQATFETCVRQPVTLAAQVLPRYADVRYRWSNGATTPTITLIERRDLTEIRRDTIRVDITIREGGQSCTFPLQTIVTYHPLPPLAQPPKVEFCLEDDGPLALDGSLGLTAPSDYRYQWRFLGPIFERNTRLPAEQIVRVEDEGYYEVIATHIPTGCQRADTVFVNEVCPVRLFLPNAFTPTGDGLNDGFVAKGAYYINYELIIYNRWGEVIFRTTDGEEEWDGTYLGAPMPSGVYPYIVSYEAEINPGPKIVKHGSVTLIR